MRRLGLFLTVALVVAALVVILGLWPTSEYAITPGQATLVPPLVSVSGTTTSDHHSRVYLVDVYLQRLSVLGDLVDHLRGGAIQFIPESSLLSPGVPASQLDAQGFLQMADSQQAATVSALRALGWKPVVTGDGAVVTEVASNSPAAVAGLGVGDLIQSLNSTPVSSGCALVRSLSKVRPGDLVHLEVAPARFSPSGVLTRLSPRAVVVRSTRAPAGVSSPCPGVGTLSAFLGVGIEDGVRVTSPVHVAVDTANIGGPSAGLAMTLSIMDRLSTTPIAGPIPIAATGTISLDGTVGEVGGVAEKTVAVERAGATVFFVPATELSQATAVAHSSLRVIGVSSLAQVLTDLRHLGAPAPHSLHAVR